MRRARRRGGRTLLLAALLLAAAPAGANAQATQAAAGALSTAGIRLVPVVGGLEHPWGMAFLPDGSMLITERDGRLRLVRDGVLDPNAIAGVPPVFASGQGGLLDVAVHPRFADNRFVYLTHAAGDDDANRTRLVRGVLADGRLEDVRTLFEVADAKSGGQHFGSRLLWLPDGTLLMSVGDGGNPPVRLNGELIRWQAQNLGSRLGKIVRLNDDGTPAADNPFAGRADADPAVWAWGLRNVQGLGYDPVRQWVWASDHGARGGDELNLLLKGENYGWPKVSRSREYRTFMPVADEASLPGLRDPQLVWESTVAPSGLAVYSGTRLPGWQGNVFVGGLKSEDVRRIVIGVDGQVLADESIEVGERVRDVRQGPDGLLYLLTDEAEGRLLRIEPAG